MNASLRNKELVVGAEDRGKADTDKGVLCAHWQSPAF